MSTREDLDDTSLEEEEEEEANLSLMDDIVTEG